MISIFSLGPILPSVQPQPALEPATSPWASAHGTFFSEA